jgi:MFS family permease
MLLGTMFLLAFSQASLFSAFPLFSNHYLNLSAGEVGLLYVCMGLIAVIIQGFLIKPLAKKFREERLFLAGSILMASGLVLIPFALSQYSLILFLCIMSVGASLNLPTLNSLISKKANSTEVGAMMGVSQGMASLGRAIGPTWSGLLYAIGFRLPFLITASLLSLTIIVGFKLRRLHLNQQRRIS